MSTSDSRANSNIVNANSPTSRERVITLEELAKHNKKTDAWMAIDGKVFDVTDYISKHPGGAAAIMLGVGKDATVMFKQVHAYINPSQVLPGKQVGILNSTSLS